MASINDLLSPEGLDFQLIRTSERTNFSRCRQKWKWAYRDHLTPINKKPALRFGDLVHQALAAYYKPSKVLTKVVRGPHPAATFLQLYEAQLLEYSEFGMYTEEDEWEDARSLGEEMLVNYIDHYGRDERYICVKPEVDFTVDLYDEYDNYVCTYAGTFDAVIYDRQTSHYGLFEHKTAKQIRTAHLGMDEQCGSYLTFAPVFFGSKGLPPLDFILYNFLRKGKKDERPTNELGQHLNQDGSVSKRQPSPLFHREIVPQAKMRHQNLVDRVVEQSKEMRLIDAGYLEPIKSISPDCSWQCEFFDMCELHERGADWTSYRDSAMTTWDPYQHHSDRAEAEQEDKNGVA